MIPVNYVSLEMLLNYYLINLPHKFNSIHALTKVSVSYFTHLNLPLVQGLSIDISLQSDPTYKEEEIYQGGSQTIYKFRQFGV